MEEWAQNPEGFHNEEDMIEWIEMWCFYYAESSFTNDDSERLENHFVKWAEVFVPNTS